MLPNIDYVSQAAGSGQNLSPRVETEKAIEAYKTPPAEPTVEQRDEFVQAEKSGTRILQSKDKADINFTLSREERDAFIAAFSSKQDSASMTNGEKETLKKASERISKFIDEAITRNSDNREKVEKAVGEWYSRITKGEQGPMDLIELMRKAAMGTLDNLSR